MFNFLKYNRFLLSFNVRFQGCNIKTAIFLKHQSIHKYDPFLVKYLIFELV